MSLLRLQRKILGQFEDSINWDEIFGQSPDQETIYTLILGIKRGIISKETVDRMLINKNNSDWHAPIVVAMRYHSPNERILSIPQNILLDQYDKNENFPLDILTQFHCNNILANSSVDPSELAVNSLKYFNLNGYQMALNSGFLPSEDLMNELFVKMNKSSTLIGMVYKDMIVDTIKHGFLIDRSQLMRLTEASCPIKYEEKKIFSRFNTDSVEDITENFINLAKLYDINLNEIEYLSQRTLQSLVDILENPQLIVDNDNPLPSFYNIIYINNKNSNLRALFRILKIMLEE